VIAGGAAYCWGSNEAAQLGIPQGERRCQRGDRLIACEPHAVAVTGGIAFRQIAAGALHSCGLTTQGSVYCWGDNLRGALGDPSVRTTSSPTRALSNDTFTQIVAGGEHTCALRTDGAAFCWGANDEGQLGIGAVGKGAAVPTAVASAQRFASIAAGARRTCGRTVDGAVYCWGATWISRQSGVDITRSNGSPERVLQAPAFRTLAVGGTSTCAIGADDAVFCWEGNALGTLGDGTTVGRVTPAVVATPLRFVDVTVGASHSCGIGVDGRAYCWGADDAGQLGRSPALLNHRCVAQTPCSVAPGGVADWRIYQQISAGQGNHTCALALSGSVYCWGAGQMGQRGDGRLSNEWAAGRVELPD
jgi:alpha-tubulin suppressor-like RCC1 family protein